MKTWKILLLTALVTWPLWILFSWPLPKYLGSGIPSSSRNIERFNVRAMIPGDHLQLLYYFWLAGDMAAGRTKLFHDLYQFNAGDDAETRRVHHYYVPFSLIFGLLSSVSTRALAWNLTGLLSFWLGYLFTFLLVRRYARDNLVAAVASLIALLLPFRWMQWTGGSSTGLGLAWAPALWLGLDMAVRESRLSGGLLAGAALLLTRCSDSHLFYFSFWSMPCWCVFAFLNRPTFGWRRPRDYLGLATALLPALFFAAGALFFTLLLRERIAESTMAGGRSLEEVVLYSPLPAGLFSWKDLPRSSNQIYLGCVPTLLVVAALAVTAWPCLRRRPGHFQSFWPLALTAAAVALIVALALGPHDPFRGRFFAATRRFVPHYRLVRQTAKVFVLTGPVLSLATALALNALRGIVRAAWPRVVLALAAAALITAEYRARLSTTVCLLDSEQPAYAAVAADAAARHTDARALALPLWPGDSAWSSVYLYYASLYRIRLVNGYHPLVSQTYYDEVFLRFASANKGELTDDQLDELLERGIRHLLLHEDLFPEKVSPFPVGVTLQRLLNHPRLDLLCQSRAVWAFRIRNAPVEKVAPPLCDLYFPARHWELEDRRRGAGTACEEMASGGAYAILEQAGTYVETQPGTLSPAPSLRWMIRVRGSGLLVPELVAGDRHQPLDPVPVESAEWIWKDVPFTLPAHSRRALRLTLAQGRVEADLALLAAGPWRTLAVGETLEIPAACFFHTGCTDAARGAVALERDRDPAGLALYGPKLPFEPGRYEVEMFFSSPAPPGLALGRFALRREDADATDWRTVEAGPPAHRPFIVADNLPLMLAFDYQREADMAIERVVFRRLE